MAKIEQVYGNTFRIVTRSMCVPFYRLNAEEIILMDSGLLTERDEIEGVLEENGYRVRAILTTHAHFDHVGNHNRFQEKYGAQVYMTAFDAGVTETALTLQACFYVDTIPDLLERYPFMICRADHIIPSGTQWLEVCGARFRVLDLPGHAHKHMGYITPDNVAYVGDLFMGEAEIGHMAMLFNQCWSQTMKSMDAACALDCRAYILAHNQVCTDLRPLAEINRKKILAQAEEVLVVMPDWVTREDINAAMVKIKIRKIGKERIRYLTRMVNSAMNYLEDTGRLECDVQDARIYYRAVKTQ